MKKNFYFRYKSDITLSLENIVYYKKSTDNRFFWNKNLVRIFKENNVNICWRVPIMQGYIQYNQISKDSYYLMINRRSKIYSGPKNYHRGISENDNQSVANYNQTEEIVKFKNNTFSYVSIRGSVPVYWKQVKSNNNIDKDYQKDLIGFHRHLQSIQKSYPQKRVYFISWLLKQQTQLRQKMDACFYHSKKHKYHQNQKYKLFNIDLDQNSKNILHFLKQKIYTSVNLWFPYKDNFFWYVQQKDTQVIMTRQKLQLFILNISIMIRIYRVNCLDCTMRTNAIMTQISRKTMRDIQQFISIQKEEGERYEQLDGIVINTWRQLGNRISRLYCGQQQVQIGKKQQSSFFSMIFTGYKDPMGAQFKQKTLQYLLSDITPKQVLWLQKNLQRKLDLLQHCSIYGLSIYILTWNCNNLNPLSINQLTKQKLLQFSSLHKCPDIIVFNLQQMVQLNTYNVLIQIDQQILVKWKQLILQIVNQKINNDDQKYVVIQEENLVAISTWILVKNNIKVKYYEQGEKTIVKTGFGNGIGGNKGAIIIFLKFHSTWICLINCHIAAGEGKKIQRKQSLQQILYSSLQDKYKQRMSQCDITFLIGDLNFRLQWNSQQIKNILYDVDKKFNKQSLKIGLHQNNAKNDQQINRYLSQLWQKDQLLNYMKNQYQFLNRFKQSKLIFMPTYKFVKKSHLNQYDDKRIPAWCDRILYQEKVKNIIKPFKYKDIDINLSDHKPVYGVFQIRVKKIQDKGKYQERFLQFKKQYYKNKSNTKDINNKKELKLNQIDFFSQYHEETNNLNGTNIINTQNNNLLNQINNNENLLDLDYHSKKQQDSSPKRSEFDSFNDIANQIVMEKQIIKTNNSINLLD